MVLLHNAWKRGVDKVKSAWNKARVGKVAIMLAIYSFGGAALFYAIELNLSNAETLKQVSACLGNYNYWASVHYVNSLYTTVGYGNVFCCTWLGQLLTCFYILFGVPLLLVVLDAMGGLFATVAIALYKKLGTLSEKLEDWADDDKNSFQRNNAGGNITDVKIHSKGSVPGLVVEDLEGTATDKQHGVVNGYRVNQPNGNQVTPLNGNNQATQPNGNRVTHQKQLQRNESVLSTGEEEHFPLSLGMLMTLMWMLMSALYFSVLEGWNYFYSMYFLWITFTTVGLGDASPTKFQLSLINYFLLIVGLSLVSMCISILQTKIANMVKRIQKNMEKEYREMVEQNPHLDPDEIAKKIKERRNSNVNGFGSFLKTTGPEEKLMALLIPKETEQRLVQDYQEMVKKSEMRSVGVQASLYQPPPPPPPSPPKPKSSPKPKTPALQERPDWKF